MPGRRAYQDAGGDSRPRQSHTTFYHGQFYYVIKPGLQGVLHPAILGTVPRAKYAFFTKG